MVDYRQTIDYPGGRLIYNMMINKSQRWRDRYLRAEILPPGWKMGITRLGRTPFFDPLIVQEPVPVERLERLERLERPLPPTRRIRGPRYQATDPCHGFVDQQSLGLPPELSDLYHIQGHGGEQDLGDQFDDYPREEIYTRPEYDYPAGHRQRGPRRPDRPHEEAWGRPLPGGYGSSPHDLDLLHHNPHPQQFQHPPRRSPSRQINDAINDHNYDVAFHDHGHQTGHHGRHGRHGHPGHHGRRGQRDQRDQHGQRDRHSHLSHSHSHPPPREHRHVHFPDDYDNGFELGSGSFERRRWPYHYVEDELEHPYDEVYYSDEGIDLHPHERLLMPPRERRRDIPYWEVDDD